MLTKIFKRKLLNPVAALAAVMIVLILPGDVPASEGLLSQQTKLTPSGAAKNDNFGASVSIEGDTALVGAYESGFDKRPGSAYVFERDDTGAWGQQAKLTASDGAEDARLGTSISFAIVADTRGSIKGEGIPDGWFQRKPLDSVIDRHESRLR